MKRRTFAAAASGTLAGFAGCLGGLTGSDGASPADAAPSTAAELSPDEDGYPEDVSEKPEDREVDTSDLDTVTENGVAVPLLPVEDAHVWWAYSRARFADARGPDQYENSHVRGAVLSPAPKDVRDEDDPVRRWGTGDRIVCYCGCPHHLSSVRASQLIRAGYEDVYVIDEGFFEWRDRDYPVTGGDGGLNEFVVRGRLDASYAGENAWARTVDGEQFESTNVEADGSFALHCKFTDVTPDSRLRVETPAWTTTGSVRELTSAVVRSD